MRKGLWKKINRPCLECEVCSRIVVDDDGTEDTPDLKQKWSQEEGSWITGFPLKWQCPHCQAWNEYGEG